MILLCYRQLFIKGDVIIANFSLKATSLEVELIIHQVKQMPHLEGTGGFTILFLGYIENTVKIPQIKGYDKCVPMLILKSYPYSSRVPVQIGTTMLDRAMARINVDELAYASGTWQ